MKTRYCKKCGKEIKKRHDLFIPTNLAGSKYNHSRLCRECYLAEMEAAYETKKLNKG